MKHCILKWELFFFNYELAALDKIISMLDPEDLKSVGLKIFWLIIQKTQS